MTNVVRLGKFDTEKARRGSQCRKLMMAFVVAVAAVEPLFATTYSWTGSGGVVDWSDATKWRNTASGGTGVLPGAADTVSFYANASYANFIVTPPADFAGVIKAMGSTASGANVTLSGSHLPARLAIKNENGANFTLGGEGTIVAFPGVEAMVDSAFTGAIDIPSGVAFAPSADFATAAVFMGDGTFRPATSAQLLKAHAFRGTLDLRGIASLSLDTDASLLMGRKVILGANVTASPSKMTTVVEPLEIGSAAKWTFNSACAASGSACVPSMDAKGVLTLPHVNGVANRTSAFLNRRFKLDESFVLKFKVKITAGKSICAWGIGFRGGELTDVGTAKETTDTLYALPAVTYGINCMYYNDYTGNINAIQRMAGTSKVQSWGSEWSHCQQGTEIGLTLRNGDPIDVTAVCHERVLSLTFTQNGSSWSTRQDVSEVFSDARGGMFGFFTHERDASGEMGNIKLEISDWKAWVASDACGQWVEDAEFSFNADNYNIYLDYMTGAVTNSFRGMDALDGQGRLRICEGAYWMGGAVSKRKVPNQRFRLEWQNDIGATVEGGEHTDIGFVDMTDANIELHYGHPDTADGYGYGHTHRQYLSQGDPIKFCSSWYQNLFGVTHSAEGGTAPGQYTGTYVCEPKYKMTDTSNVGKWFYDGTGLHTVRFANSGERNNRVFKLTGQSIGTSRRLSFVGGGNKSRNNYTKNWLGGVKLSLWNPDYVAKATLAVEAPAGVTTSMKGIGAYSPVGSVNLADTDARISFTGEVVFGDVLEIVVPNEFLKTIRTKATLVDLSGATVSGAQPTTVKLVDATGAAVNMRGRTVTMTANGAELSAPLGLILVVQ